MNSQPNAVEIGLRAAGVGPFQYRIFVIFGLVWAADAMQVLAIGFTAPSIARSFGVPLPTALQTGTTFFVGMLIGAFVFGRLADRVGRRPVLMVTILIDAVFGVASAFAPDFQWLLWLRLLTGIGVGGTLLVDYTMMAEFLPADRRGRWLVLLESFWAVGTILLAVLSLFAARGSEAWRTIFLATGMPAVVGLFLRFYVPESPFYLNRIGRSNEARTVLERIARVNGSISRIAPLTLERMESRSLLALFSPTLRRRSVFMFLAWALTSMSYYAVFVYLPIRLSDAGFGYMRGQLFLVLTALVQLPGFMLSAYGVERWGRKPTLLGFLALSATGCLVYGLGTAPTIVVGATLLMSFSLLGSWGAIYAFTPEIYPTGLRASGMGTAGAVARMGGLLAPSIVAPIMASNLTASLAMISSFLTGAAICIWLIDVESKDKILE